MSTCSSTCKVYCKARLLLYTSTVYDVGHDPRLMILSEPRDPRLEAQTTGSVRRGTGTGALVWVCGTRQRHRLNSPCGMSCVMSCGCCVMQRPRMRMQNGLLTLAIMRISSRNSLLSVGLLESVSTCRRISRERPINRKTQKQKKPSAINSTTW